MARNIEIKAHVADWQTLKAKAASMADEGPVEIVQDDIFFSCPNGRFKLRILSKENGQLVFYRRPDQEGPKLSHYFVSLTQEPGVLRDVMARAYGEAGRVRKVRTLYMVGRTRVHLDRVEGLGDFMELEVVLADGEPLEKGQEEADRLRKDLGIAPDQLIDVAYIDLIEAKKNGKAETQSR